MLHTTLVAGDYKFRYLVTLLLAGRGSVQLDNQKYGGLDPSSLFPVGMAIFSFPFTREPVQPNRAEGRTGWKNVLAG